MKGPIPSLNLDIEEWIYNWLIKMARIGYVQSKEDFFNQVQKLVMMPNIWTAFVNGCPSNKWYRLFLKWHPDLKRRLAQLLLKQWASITQDTLENWF